MQYRKIHGSHFRDMGSINQIMKDRASCGDLLECLFDLTNTDISVFLALNDSKPLDLDSVAGIIGKNRSTAYRSLQKLVCMGLAVKETENISEGGYFHTYTRVGNDSIRNMILSRTRDLSGRISEIVNSLDSDLSSLR